MFGPRAQNNTGNPAHVEGNPNEQHVDLVEPYGHTYQDLKDYQKHRIHYLLGMDSLDSLVEEVSPFTPRLFVLLEVGVDGP